LYGFRPQPAPEYELLLKHPQFGASLYESHADGRGMRYSSWLRPLVNVRPESRMWSFNADTAVLHWLERETPAYDLLTDHDLQARGIAALAGARVVVTGTHPEYYSKEMLDALEAFLDRGGRLMYMGGNGFYWRTAFSGAWPAAIEVRRAEDGTRAWIEEPAEYHHAFDGELGGLWRRLRRPPNRLVGVGFAAQGFSTSAPYHVAAGARDSRAAFVFAGIERDIIGDFGARGGGAAGEEIDRFDTDLGSPAHAVVLASSREHAPDMLRVKEELHASAPIGPDPNIRADLVFFETPAGGAVFSTGSIAWAGALSEADYANDVARLSRNVLRRFADPATFEFPRGESSMS
jgi:N,N-dimethylformamidase